MIGHDFDPWAEIERLRLHPAKVAKAAKPAKPAGAADDFSHFSRFSQVDPPTADGVRCRRCPTLQERGIAILRCPECGYVYRPLTTGRFVDDPPRRSRR